MLKRFFGANETIGYPGVLDSMRDHQVWNLVDQPDGVNPIECKWIFKKKRDMDGNIHIYKA
jgi:hypothetical protein